jgi:hypothetical protein
MNKQEKEKQQAYKDLKLLELYDILTRKEKNKVKLGLRKLASKECHYCGHKYYNDRDTKKTQ